jgi:hypothetical protein
MLVAGLASYLWRKRAIGRSRRIGGIILILAPVFLQAVFATVAALPGIVQALNSLSPVSDITYFEAAWLFSLFWAPFWSFGALCGFMLRSIIERPLRW